MANPVEGVGCGVGGDVLADGFHDEAERHDEEHEEEPLDSAPDVDDFGDGEGGYAASDGGYDSCGAEETVGVECGGNVGCEVGVDG